MGWPCYVSPADECESGWPVLGSCGIFSQILLYLSSWWANCNPFVAGICTTFSFPSVPHTLLHVLLLSSRLLPQDPSIIVGPHHTFSWKGLCYAKSNVLPISWACIFHRASVAGYLLPGTAWMDSSSPRWQIQRNFPLCLLQASKSRIGFGLDLHPYPYLPIKARPLESAIKIDFSIESAGFIMYFLQLSSSFFLPHASQQDPTWHPMVQFSSY